MANAPRQKPKGGLALPWVVLRDNPSVSILLKASGIIQSGAVFYDEKLHKGKNEHGQTLITCPKCELPDVHANRQRSVAGDRKVRRDHFARNANSYHADFCEWLYTEEEHGPPREINYAKGAYFHLNTKKLPDRPPYRDVYKKASSRIPKELTQPPPWVVRIDYEENKHGYDSIANADFKDRLRLRGISHIRDYLSLLHTIPPQKLKDTWVLNQGVAVNLDKAIIRIGTGHFANRTPEEMVAHRQAAKLGKAFLMASNPNYDKYAALLNTERENIKHPVLLHFKADSKPYRETRNGETFWTIRLSEFKVENPERKKPRPHPLALPEVSVRTHVHIYDADIAKGIKVGQEFFAIAHPNLSIQGEDSPNRTYYQHFNVIAASDITQKTQQELAKSLAKSAAARIAHIQHKSKEPVSEQLNLV